MLLKQKGSPARRAVHFILSAALRLFFRRIETQNAESVPKSGPIIFVLNHPNGLIDPALVFTALPRRISFLAKSTLFRTPVIGGLLRTVEALPLYRRVDAGEDLSRNRKTFEAAATLLRRGRCIAIFPEGVSHNEPRLLPLKTGAARIALGAASVYLNDADEARVENEASHAPLDLKIAPVGLYYTSKTSFRSEALLRFGEPFDVTPVELEETGEPPRESVRELSARIEEGLRAVTLNVESQEELEAARRAEQLFSSLYEGVLMEQSLASRFAFLKGFALWPLAGRDPSHESVKNLRERVRRYDEELRRLGLAPENLSVSNHSAWFVFRRFLLRGALMLMLSPLALVGALLHLPAFTGATIAAMLYPRHGPDVATATAKILVAILLVPLTWLTVSVALFFLWDWRAALASFPLTALCGYIALRTFEELYDMRGWFKGSLLLLRQRRLFLRLLLERRRLHNELSQLGEGGGF